jgi:putative DNA primase/helicase
MRPVREIALGRWPGILAAIGVPERALNGKHGPCPMCGGRDRFRFDDKDGRGTFYCSHCGAGDGVALVMAFRRVDFKSAAQEIESIAGVVRYAQDKPLDGDNRKMERLRRVWSEAHPLVAGDEVMRYLAGRGLPITAPPSSLRLHQSLPYHDGERIISRYPAMLALVQAPDGSGATVHRTYLQDGSKAPVESPKKLMSGKPVQGSAIRLFSAGACLGIAEGIETALAASVIHRMPVWSVVNANGIETFVPPDGVERLVVFGDNDASYTGQKSAFAAAFRLQQMDVAVEVRIPPIVGDWLDVLNGSKRLTYDG